MTEYDSFTQKGWQCPVCGRVYSPSFPWCIFCGNGEKTVTTTTDILVKSPESYQPPKPAAWASEGWYMDIINEALKSMDKK